MHRRTATLWFTFLLMLFAGGTPATKAQMTLDSEQFDAELQPLGLELRWEGQATLDITQDVVLYVRNDEDNVYVQSRAGMLTTLHAENGRRLWAKKTGEHGDPVMPATSNSTHVVVTAGPVIYGYDKFRGNLLFKHRLPGQPSTNPTMDEELVYVPIDGGSIYVYPLATLEYQTRFNSLPDGVARAHLYKFVCGETIIHPPIVGDDSFGFVSEAGSFYSVISRGPELGQNRFQLLLSGAASNDIAITDELNGPAAIILTGDDQVTQIDMKTGTTLWSFAMGRKMTQRPIAVGGGVYIVTAEESLTRLNRDSRLGPLGRPARVPAEASPLRIGVGLREIDLPEFASDLLDVNAATAVEVTEVAPGSPAEVAGLQVKDVLVFLNDITLDSVETASRAILELDIDTPARIIALRNAKVVRMDLRLASSEWVVPNVDRLLAVGRFGVYGLDAASRLLAFDRQTASLIGKTRSTPLNLGLINSATDQIYLADRRGHVVCIREIGPVVTVPEFSAQTSQFQVTEVFVSPGTGVETSGTKICAVSDAAGNTYEVISSEAGVISQIMFETGDLVVAGQPLVRISDDQFATYHNKPQDRPVEVDLSNGAEPTGPDGN